MNPVLTLSLIAALEGIVYQIRYRASSGQSVFSSSWSTMLTCVLRVWFVVAGASATIKGTPLWLVMAAYAIPAVATTFFTHKFQLKREAA